MPKTSPRLTADEWLSAALDTLYEDGIHRVKVEPLAERLGVTKGSFYWHFRDRDHLIAEMIAAWEAQQVGFLDRLRTGADRPAEERFDELLGFIHRKNSGHDVGMRGLSRVNDDAAEAVARIDRKRIAYCESIFRDLGFTSDEAKMRGRLIYFAQVGEYTLGVRDGDRMRDRLLKLRRKLLLSR